MKTWVKQEEQVNAFFLSGPLLVLLHFSISGHIFRSLDTVDNPKCRFSFFRTALNMLLTRHRVISPAGVGADVPARVEASIQTVHHMADTALQVVDCRNALGLSLVPGEMPLFPPGYVLFWRSCATSCRSHGGQWSGCSVLQKMKGTGSSLRHNSLKTLRPQPQERIVGMDAAP